MRQLSKLQRRARPCAYPLAHARAWRAYRRPRCAQRRRRRRRRAAAHRAALLMRLRRAAPPARRSALPSPRTRRQLRSTALQRRTSRAAQTLAGACALFVVCTQSTRKHTGARLSCRARASQACAGADCAVRRAGRAGRAAADGRGRAARVLEAPRRAAGRPARLPRGHGHQPRRRRRGARPVPRHGGCACTAGVAQLALSVCRRADAHASQL